MGENLICATTGGWDSSNLQFARAMGAVAEITNQLKTPKEVAKLTSQMSQKQTDLTDCPLDTVQKLSMSAFRIAIAGGLEFEM